jgi:hypothetical protein
MATQRQISEPDWKRFRHLRELALERFCERVLSEIGQLASEPGPSAHERYLAVYKLLQRRDKNWLIVTEFGVGFSEEQQAIPALVGVEDGSQGHPSRVHLRRVPGAETSAPSAKSLWILRLRQAHRQPPGTTQSPQNA